MMGTAQLGRFALRPLATTLWISTVTTPRLDCAGEITGIATFAAPAGSTVVGHTLWLRSDLGTRNRVSAGSRIVGGALSDKFAVNGAGGEGTGGVKGDGGACLAATCGRPISGTASLR